VCLATARLTVRLRNSGATKKKAFPGKGRLLG
jgi:hypothetical protein